MKLRYPLYYKKFSCIADRCTDNCCVGWEIDIDPATKSFYDTVKGDFGKRLRDNIENSSFKLCGERCPFLNERNLCDIIINLGSEHLCYICDNHPRYYGWYGDIKEGSVGLSCEAAAKLILTEGSGQYYEVETDEEGEEENEKLLAFLQNARKKLFEIFEGNLSFAEKIAISLNYAEDLQDCMDMGLVGSVPQAKFYDNEMQEADLSEFVSLFSRFEPIDQVWTEKLNSLNGKSPETNDTYLSRIFVYFLWRYFMKALFDEDLLSKVCFAAAGCLMISVMAEDTSLDAYISAAKLYSKEMEYSEDNRDMLMYDLYYGEDILAPSSLISLIGNK